MALQKTVSGQEGQACRSCEEEMGGGSELQASQSWWRCRLLAVRMEDSERTVSPGRMSAVAKRPSWRTVAAGVLAKVEEVRSRRGTDRTSHFGATSCSWRFRIVTLVAEKRSGSWVFQGYSLRRTEPWSGRKVLGSKVDSS